MSTTSFRFSISCSPGLRRELDEYVNEDPVYHSRAEFIRHAIREKLDREW
jgi:metal-responsive CopG/Arc/MetJ family transcriptional regulator